MPKKLTGRETVAAGARDAGWSTVSEPTVVDFTDVYRRGSSCVRVEYSVTGAITSASTPKYFILGAGKADRVADFLRTHGADGTTGSAKS